jgi:hypothetical protein
LATHVGLDDGGEMQLAVEREVVHVAGEILHLVCLLVVRSLIGQPMSLPPPCTHPICAVLVSVIPSAVLRSIFGDLGIQTCGIG